MILNGDEAKVGHGATQGLQRNVPSDDLRNAPSRTQLCKGNRQGAERIGDSWFEDDAEAARIVGERRGGPRSKRVEHVLNVLVAQRRAKWVDLVLRTAVWLRDADASGELSWREFAIVAKALAEGVDLGEIGLMREVASQTVDVLGT